MHAMEAGAFAERAPAFGGHNFFSGPGRKWRESRFNVTGATGNLKI